MYKGDLKGFPSAIVEKMLEKQVEQGNEKNVEVFEKNLSACKKTKGFDWDITIETQEFWEEVIFEKNFELFFEKYPNKQILGYKLEKKEYKKAALAIVPNSKYLLYNISKSGKHYIAVNTNTCYLLEKAGVLNLWFTLVYEEETKVIIGKPAFEVIVRDNKAYCDGDDITAFVKSITSHFQSFEFGGYTAVIKELTFSRTGCKHSLTTIEDWRNIAKKLK